MTVQSPVALKDSVERLRLFKKRNATIAAIGTIRPISERSMIGGSFGSSRFGKNCERFLKEQSSNEAMGPSGTGESSHACEREMVSPRTYAGSELLLRAGRGSLSGGDQRAALAPSFRMEGREKSFETSYREYVENQYEKDMVVYAVRDAVGRIENIQKLAAPWIKSQGTRSRDTTCRVYRGHRQSAGCNGARNATERRKRQLEMPRVVTFVQIGS